MDSPATRLGKYIYMHTYRQTDRHTYVDREKVLWLLLSIESFAGGDFFRRIGYVGVCVCKA